MQLHIARDIARGHARTLLKQPLQIYIFEF